MTGPDDDRLARLERRVAELESWLGMPLGPEPVAESVPEPVADAPLMAAARPPVPGPALVVPIEAEPIVGLPATPSPTEGESFPFEAPPRRSRGLAELEEQLTGRALAVVGGVALVVGAVFFLSLAFSRGWIGPEGRVLIGIAGSGVALALGAWMLDHAQPIVGRVLVAVGLAVVSLSMFAATRLYGLVPVEIGLLGTLVASVAAAFLAVRNDAQVIAVLSLVAVLGAPPVLGASATMVTVGYVGTVLAGFAALSLYRTWRLLPTVAFLLSAPQLATWLFREPSPAIGFVAATVFWVLNIVAAGGEEYLRPGQRLRLGSANLVLANAAFLVAAGFVVLDGPATWLRGPFLVAVALAHVVVAGVFLLREGDRHPFGLLVAGTAAAALAMAAPVQFGGPPVPIAWAAQAAALAWIASVREHRHAALAAAVLGALAVGHLVLFEYPIGAPPRTVPGEALPFINANGLTLAFLVGAAAVGGWFLRNPAIVSLLGAVVAGAVAVAAPHELRGPALMGAWVGVAVAAVAFDAFVVRVLPKQGPREPRLPREVEAVSLVAAVAVAAITLIHAITVELPIEALLFIQPPAMPFSDARALTIALLVTGAALAGWIHMRRFTLELPAVVSLVGAGLVFAYGSLFEVYLDAAIVIAAGLAALGFLLGDAPGVDDRGWLVAVSASVGLLACALVATLGVVAPPDRLTVSDTALIKHPPFVSGATATLAALAGALAVGVSRNRGESWARWGGLACGVLLVYLVSIGVVDIFQSRIPGPILFEELATQAQVALSVVWVVLGAAVFIFGLGRGSLVVRQAGLALLALASAKVFVFDLASLDVAYRVLSLVALGTFLLLSAWVYARLRPRAARESPSAQPATPQEGSSTLS